MHKQKFKSLIGALVVSLNIVETVKSTSHIRGVIYHHSIALKMDVKEDTISIILNHLINLKLLILWTIYVYLVTLND